MQKSSAICVTAYDLSGNPLSDEVVDRVIKAVEKATEQEKLAINVART
jgi:hypothetical protein